MQPLTAGASKPIAWDINSSSAGSTTVGAGCLATCSGPVSVLESGRDRASSGTSGPSSSILSKTCSVCSGPHDHTVCVSPRRGIPEVEREGSSKIQTEYLNPIRLLPVFVDLIFCDWYRYQCNICANRDHTPATSICNWNHAIETIRSNCIEKLECTTDLVLTIDKCVFFLHILCVFMLPPFAHRPLPTLHVAHQGLDDSRSSNSNSTTTTESALD